MQKEVSQCEKIKKLTTFLSQGSVMQVLEFQALVQGETAIGSKIGYGNKEYGKKSLN